MINTTVHYMGKTYRAHIITSTTHTPHFYWLCFDDPELVNLLEEDCVAFKIENDQLVHVNRIAAKHSGIVVVAMNIIKLHMAG